MVAGGGPGRRRGQPVRGRKREGGDGRRAPSEEGEEGKRKEKEKEKEKGVIRKGVGDVYLKGNCDGIGDEIDR